MVNVQGVVGEAFYQDGAPAQFRMLPLGSLAQSQIHGKRFGMNYYNRTFFAAHQASTVLTLLGAATYTGLAVFNPQGSNVVASIEEVGVGFAVATSGYAGVVMFGFTGVPTAFTSGLTTFPSKFTFGWPGTVSPSKTLAYTSLTLAAAPGTPTAPVIRPLAAFLGTQTASDSAQAVVKDEVSGAVLLEPGTGVGIVAVTTAINIVGSVSWEEIPLRNFQG